MQTRAYFWIYVVLSGIVLLAPIRRGDLAGYDDALYAHMAKGIVITGDWLNIRSNGYDALEHPPMLPWMEAALFSFFGFSDFLAKLPSALSGWGTVILVYVLARRLLANSLHALIAMFVMAGSIYFIKYSARAMTDVPFTFFFLSAVLAWTLADENPRWYIAVGIFAGCAQMTRGMMGLALPLIFLLHSFVTRRRPPGRYVATVLTLTFAPLFAWYAHRIYMHGFWFFSVHSAWLDREVYGSLSPPWRRYTGAFEYAWMIAKSYWPWVPFMVTGLVTVIRSRDRRWALLVIWVAVVFAFCAAARSRVLRYMLPAYPAFAILASIGLVKLISEWYIRYGFQILTPVLAVGVLVIGIWPPTRWHAASIHPIAAAASAAAPVGERVAFYDAGQPRFDETNQLQWYGDRYLYILTTADELRQALEKLPTRVFVVDRSTYFAHFRSRSHQVFAESGHLVCLRLAI